LNQQMQAPATL